MGDEGLLVVYVTAPEAKAPELARALVERRVAACVNILPGVRSIYTWQGAVQDDVEALLVIKTARATFEALRAAVVELHPYEVPEVIALEVARAHEPYARWVREGTSAPKAADTAAGGAGGGP